MAAVRSPYELPGLEAERDGQPFQIVDREIPQTTLDAADVTPIDLAEIGELVLAEPFLGTDPPQVGREDFPKGAWMGSFHARIERGCGR